MKTVLAGVLCLMLVVAVFAEEKKAEEAEKKPVEKFVWPGFYAWPGYNPAVVSPLIHYPVQYQPVHYQWWRR